MFEIASGSLGFDGINRIRYQTKNIQVDLIAYTKAVDDIDRILNESMSNLNPLVAGVLHADALGRIGNVWLLTLANYIAYADSGLFNNPNKMALLFKDWTKRFDVNFNDAVIARSQSVVDGYTNYLMQKAILESIIDNGGKQCTFKDVYNRIKSNHDGILREHLLVYLFASPFFKTPLVQQSDELVSPCLKDAQSVINDPRLKEIMGKMKTRTRGNPAYNFELEDPNGRTVRLTDFKGKVIMMELWFDRCTQCAVFHQNFEEYIYPDIKSNPNFKVVSVNTDKEKKRWLASMATGKYTETGPGYVNVYTKGLGFADHPMIKHYYLNGAPFILLIDREGRVITEITYVTPIEEIKSTLKEALKQ